MFRPNNADQEIEEQKTFVQNALRRRFQGDSQLLFRDFPAFMEHPDLKALLVRYAELQDAVHEAFVAARFGAPEPEIALEAADPDLEIVLVEEEILVEADQPAGLEVVEENSEENGLTEDEIEKQTIDAAPIDLPTDAIDIPEGKTEEFPIPEPEIDPRMDASEKPEEEFPTDLPGNETPAEEGLEENAFEAINSELPTAGDGDEPPIDNPGPEPETIEEKAPVEPTVKPVKLNLPNGKMGVDYLQKIDISPLHRSLENLTFWEATGFDQVGLTFNYDGELSISGCPDNHGKVPVTILLRFAAEGELPAQDYLLQGEIDILPDPRKMWKDIEPDATLPYQKPHLRGDFLHMAGRTMVAASRRGRSHAHSGTFRDDEFELSVSEPQSWYIMAVADGAGSAPYSRRGSQIAVEKAVEVLQAKLDEKLSGDLEALAGAWSREPNEQVRGQIRSRIYEALSHAAYAGYKAICEEADSLGETPKTFHTTLMITIVRQFDFGYFVGTWWVGDGAVGVLQQGKYLKVMGTPDGGQFAGQTRFLTMPEIWTDGATVMKRIEFDVVQDFTAVILMTDGVSDPKFHTDHNMLQQAHWDKLWDELSETVAFDHDNLDAPEQLLEWLDFWAAGEHDDRTIAILF